jgi:hypothetical protein
VAAPRCAADKSTLTRTIAFFASTGRMAMPPVRAVSFRIDPFVAPIRFMGILHFRFFFQKK